MKCVLIHLTVVVYVLLLVSGTSLGSSKYAGYKVARAYIENAKQITVINSWDLDVWSRESSIVVGWNDIVVNDDHLIELLKLEVPYDLLINDLEEHFAESERDLVESRRDAVLADFFTAYHTYDEFVAYLTNITNVYSSISKYVPSVGKSIQGRDIFGVTITGTATGTKKKIFITGGQHAREWIAPATVVYIINQLLTGYATNNAVKTLLDSTSIYFIPLVNVDGYPPLFLISTLHIPHFI
jgi:hypothetical protein